jgi:hypothetical protein
MVRRLFFVFGSPRATRLPLSVRASVGLTLTVAFSKLRSDRFSPRSSPLLMPVVMAST